MVTAFAPGKIIFFGEHSAVYGYPALAASIDKGVYVTIEKSEKCGLSSEWNNFEFKWADVLKSDLKNDRFNFYYSVLKRFVEKNKIQMPNISISIKSELPKGCGASSATFAAMTLALHKMFGMEISKDELFEYVSRADELCHKRASGIDAETVVYQGYILHKKDGFSKLKAPELKIIVADSGVKSTTEAQVKKIEKLKGSKRFGEIVAEIGRITNEGIASLENSDIKKVGGLMNENHKLLRELGVSCGELDRIVEIALENGAYGAKLTGAGGGGAAIILGGDLEKIQEALKKNNFDSFVAEIRVP